MEERELILRANVEDRLRSDMLAVAISVAARYFSRDLLFRLFHEELQMLKEASFIEEWIAEGEKQGLERGRTLEARENLLRLLGARFEAVPGSVVTRVENASRDWCEAMLERAARVTSLSELEL